MIGGILIGIGVSALAFLIVWLLRGGAKPSPATYIVLLVAVVVLSIEGVLMNKAFHAKNNLNQRVTLVQETIMTYLPQQGQDYTITAEQATAIRLGLSLVMPSMADYFGENNLAGKTIAEATDAIRESIVASLAKQVRKTIWVLVVSSIVFILLLYFAYTIPIGGIQYGKKTKGSHNYSSTPSRVDDF